VSLISYSAAFHKLVMSAGFCRRLRILVLGQTGLQTATSHMLLLTPYTWYSYTVSMLYRSPLAIWWHPLMRFPFR